MADGIQKTGSPVVGSWTPVICNCCNVQTIQPLIALELTENICLETKRWLMSKIEGMKKHGGAELLVHPGEDDDGNLILISATKHSLLKATEVTGLAKPYSNGSMMVFSYNDRANFTDADDVEKFLTLSERQYLVKHELDSVKATNDTHIPGYPMIKLCEGASILHSLQKRRIVLNIYPLHDEEKLNTLTKAWYSQLYQVMQPIDFVRAYFGDPVAFYFSFLGFFTISLVPMAVVGGIYYLFPIDALAKFVFVAGFNVIWSTVTLELWKRYSTAKAYHWGSLLMKKQFEEPRVNYWGSVSVNPVTGRKEPYWPRWKRKLRVAMGSAPAVCVFLGLAMLGMVGFVWLETWAKEYYENDSELSLIIFYLPCVVHTLYLNTLSSIYETVSKTLTEWENHRLESSFQSYLTLKALVFSFFNGFATLFYIAFYMQDLELLQKKLISRLIVPQITDQLTETLLPYVCQNRTVQQWKNPKVVQDNEPFIDKIKDQGNLPGFPGIFADYMELFMQFGFACLFSCVCPLTAVLLLVNNVMEIRTDALKFCRVFQKPFCHPATNIGIWQTAFEMLGYFSVITNCFLICISPQVREFAKDYGITTGQLILYTAIVELLQQMESTIPDIQTEVNGKRKR
ncbi:anoctamin-10-like isoform X2 [Protopterus annectens]|uniref:anoctamin-10-like isoform X2 n=1 Tax=Protopterus annectens TaxID=7888 RepID=UPI001CFA8591|nr:anoctamin-10-like isoform X2 [Protopterus annectens]